MLYTCMELAHCGPFVCSYRPIFVRSYSFTHSFIHPLGPTFGPVVEHCVIRVIDRGLNRIKVPMLASQTNHSLTI